MSDRAARWMTLVGPLVYRASVGILIVPRTMPHASSLALLAWRSRYTRRMPNGIPKPKKEGPQPLLAGDLWWAMRDSNPRPCACKAPALAAAPIARVCNRMRLQESLRTKACSRLPSLPQRVAVQQKSARRIGSAESLDFWLPRAALASDPRPGDVCHAEPGPGGLGATPPLSGGAGKRRANAGSPGLYPRSRVCRRSGTSGSQPQRSIR